ncbi:MAG: tyrosine-type recombinase/integrase [Methylocystaceae bacterium]|nr:tyrosine-type recombinase/integrase [Methylocystaceae bacterium]
MRITDSYISKLKAPSGKPVEYFDAREKGYGVRIGKKGQVKFIIDYQLTFFNSQTSLMETKRYRKTFGIWDRISPNPETNKFNEPQARAKARQFLDKAAKNKDPFGIVDGNAEKIEFVSDLLKVFQDKHIARLTSKSTQYSYSQGLRVHLLPKLGHIPLRSLSSRHIDDFHKNIAALADVKGMWPQQGGKPTANRCLGILKVALNKAVLWGYLDKNPAIGIKPFKEKGRTRYLNEDELQQLHQAIIFFESDPTKKYKYQDCIDAVRIALMTGCRRGELLATKWDNVNLTGSPATWSKPCETTKQNEWEHIPLAPKCVEIFQRRKIENMEREVPSEYVFPLKEDTTRHMLDLKHSWTTLRKQAGLKDFRFHDLRHTFASHMAIQGKSLYVIGKMLGHKNAQTTQRYAKLNTGALEDLANSMSAVVQAAVQAPVPANNNNSNQQKERESA